MKKFYSEFQPKVTKVRENLPQNRTRFLGEDSDGKAISVFVTVRYGPTIAVGRKGETDVAYYSNSDLFSLDQVDTITFNEAIEIIKKIKHNTPQNIIFPYECDGTTYNLIIKPPRAKSTTHYFKWQDRFVPVLPSIDINNITNADIDKCISAKRYLYDFNEFQVFEGKAEKAPFIAYPSSGKGKFPFIYISIDTSKYDMTKLSKEDCLEIINNSPKRFYIPTFGGTETAPLPKKTTKKSADTSTTPSKKRQTTKKSETSDADSMSSTTKKRQTTKKSETSDTEISTTTKRKTAKKSETSGSDTVSSITKKRKTAEKAKTSDL